MPHLRNYHLLISHSWKYSNQYETIRTWLNRSPYFSWSDYSVCCDEPLNTHTDWQLQNALSNRIANCSAVIVVSGMYANYSKWIDFEIDTAIRYGKPIIGIRPWGAERIPAKIQNNSTVMVYWQSASLVEAIRQYAI